MKEIKDIIKAYKEATNNGRKTALATVVHVEGSSYRRPGARMLVTEDGQLTGAISGGCLEGDALRKALLAISKGQNKLVTYDTTDEDDAKFGVQLGCNGIVYVLFEPIHEAKKYNAIYLLEKLVSKREAAVLATLFSLQHLLQPGTSLLLSEDELQSSLATELTQAVLYDAHQAFQQQGSSIKKYQQEGKDIQAFIEFIQPPAAIIIAGAGNDVQPLVKMAAILGWHTTVIDGRATHATVPRFPTADKVLTAKPEEVVSRVTIDPQTVFLLMTHNYNYDLSLLKSLLRKDCSYIGLLGPKKKMERMFNELKDQGVTITAAHRSKIFSPVGLDIGAETPEEIAVSIIAEIKAVLSARRGTSLKEKASPIHSCAIKTSTAHD